MRKISFLSSLAAVAFVGLSLASCEKESLSINDTTDSSTGSITIEKGQAKVTVAYTVMDATTNKQITDATITVNGTAVTTPLVTYADASSVAAKTLEIVASAADYNAVSRTVYTPAAAQGEVYYVPVVIYLNPITNSQVGQQVQWTSISMTPTSTVTTASEAVTDDFSDYIGKTNATIEFYGLPSGDRLANTADLKAAVAALKTSDAKAVTKSVDDDADLITAQNLMYKEIDNRSAFGNGGYWAISDVNVPASYKTFTATCMPTIKTYTGKLRATVNEKYWEIPANIEEVASYYIVTTGDDGAGHTHTHTHGTYHGSDANAGGGQGSAE